MIRDTIEVCLGTLIVGLLIVGPMVFYQEGMHRRHVALKYGPSSVHNNTAPVPAPNGAAKVALVAPKP